MIQNFKICFFLITIITFASQVSATDNVNVNADSNTIELLDQHLKNEIGNIVYVDFWASWCIPCRKSFPWMNNLKAQYQEQGLTIISINLDHSRELADEFLMTIPANFPVIYDPKGLIARKYKLKGMPSSFIINRQGQIVSGHVGFNLEKQLAYEKEIHTLLYQVD
ncbi:TlpA disulfide reductase family protein [Cognaticolwellia beringensis]|uniref:TlpA disulfide reductase family protein n=1 Tax=Cognaticolwellia beringensis TaxID=1967665 RepID=UPI0009BCB9CD|nr:TlpA disulfide reductase family protein [Cognaticolwellia beringensis]